MEGLFSCSANYVPLSPISFLERAKFVYGERLSIIYGDTTRYTWAETYDRCFKVASALSQLGLHSGDIVAALAPNIPALYELHFAVPMAGAVLSTLNTRLDPPMLATVLEQLKAKAIFVDYQFIQVVLKSFDIITCNPPQLILIMEHDQSTLRIPIEIPQKYMLYNELLAMGKPDFLIVRPTNELDPISVNYTSGSTGTPKGTIYSHRAAYLNSLAVIFTSEMKKMSVFLWTVDMFRCNGWCFTWAMAALGGINICIREVTPKVIFDSIAFHKVTHIFGPPVLLNKIADSPSSDIRPIQMKVEILVAGVLPPPQVIKKVQNLGFNVNLGYGMTEALGPMMVQPLEAESDDEVTNTRYREGVHNILMEEVDVKNGESMKSVPADGKTIGEVMFRGNVLMSGYLNNLVRAQSVLKDGWYRTGDLGVRHATGHIEMKDRIADQVVIEGETISTLAIEVVLVSHPMVSEAAVIGRSSDDFGIVLYAFVNLKEGCCLTSEEIINFCKGKLSRHMVPTNVVFGNLPVNSTGKIQKFLLREKSKAIEMVMERGIVSNMENI